MPACLGPHEATRDLIDRASRAVIRCQVLASTVFVTTTALRGLWATTTTLAMRLAAATVHLRARGALRMGRGLRRHLRTWG